MRCAKCGRMTPAKHAKNFEKCVSCGDVMLPTAQELLSDPRLGVVQEIRPAQVEYGKMVELTLQGDKQHTAFLEAGTGVGKGRGYCTPSILRRRRFVISTGKKNLQDQLDSKDLPQLIDAIGIPMKVVSLKGKGNYVCQKKLEKNESLFLHEGKGAYHSKIVRWLDKNPLGDTNKVPFRWEYPATLCVADECLGKGCSKAKGCGFLNQRVTAREADILVVNHALLGFDLKLGVGTLFDPYDLLIIDEAHLAVDFFRGAFSQSISPTWLKNFFSKLTRDQIDHPNVKRKPSEKVWDALFESLKPASGKPAVNEDGGLPPGFLGDKLPPVLAMLEGLREDLLGNIVNRWGKKAGLSPKTKPSTLSQETISTVDDYLYHRGLKDSQDDLRTIMMRHTKLDEVVEALKATEEEDDNIINCLEMTKRGAYKIVRRPVDIAKYVQGPLSSIKKKILTSATLPFDLVSSELGITPTSSLTIPPEFDYKNNALLYLPRHLPRPPSGQGAPIEGYCEELAEEIVKLCRMSQGNAFILFPNRKHMECVADIIHDDYDFEFPLHGQMQDTSAKIAMERFMAEEGAVLFGLKSFFEGVDVQGEKLRLVVLTKIPFPAPNELNRAKERVLGGKYWPKYYFPLMLNDVQQAMGRLIRSQTDQGVAAILDPRVWVAGDSGADPKTVGVKEWKAKNKYGHKIFRALPFPSWTDDIYYIQQFFENLFDNAGE